MASFMALPPEVRIAVYRHLVPTLPVQNYRRRDEPLRHDGQRCCPALLRANRTVYHELVREWYSAADYEVTLDASSIRFCDNVIPPDARLPSTLRWVTSLTVCVFLQRTPRGVDDGAALESLLGFHDRLTALAQALGDRETGQLRRLVILLAVNVPLLLTLCKTPRELLELMEWNLGPLRDRIRGLDQMAWENREQSYAIQSPEFCDEYQELKGFMEGFLEGMRREMLAEPR